MSDGVIRSARIPVAAVRREDQNPVDDVARAAAVQARRVVTVARALCGGPARD